MFKRLLFGLFIGLSIYKPLKAELQAERFFDNTGGLVDRYSPILIPGKNASSIQNVQFDTRGQLLKRGGYLKNNTTNLTVSTVTGAGYLQSTTGTSFMAVVVGTNIYTTGNTYGGTYTNVTGTVTITNAGTNLAQFTNFKDFAVMCNVSDTPVRIQSGSAFAIVKAATTAQTCESFNNYLLIGNTAEAGTTYGSRLRWSDLGDINTWPANNYIDIEPDDGDSLVSIRRYQTSTYAFKKRALYEILLTGGSGAEAFVVRPVAKSIGAWAKNSVQTIEDKGIVFLGADGVYLFDGQNFDFISDPIQTKMNGMNRSRYSQAVGVVYPAKHQYWLAMSEGTSTLNNTILVWDYIQNSWTVYSGITANMLVKTEDSSGNIVIFSGDNNGGVFKQDVGTTDAPLGVASGINAFYATSDLTFGAPEVTKDFKYLYLFSKVTTTTTAVVEAAFDFSDTYQDTKTLALGSIGAVWNTAVWGTDVWPGNGTTVTRVELNRRARALRLKFSDTSSTQLGVLGWTVVYSAEDFRGD